MGLFQIGRTEEAQQPSAVLSCQRAGACQIKSQTLCVASEAQEKRSLNEASMGQVQNNEKEICLRTTYNSAKDSFAVAHCGCEKFTRINSWKKKIHQGLLTIGTSLPSQEVLEPEIAGGWKVS